MERLQQLIGKLKEQFEQKASASQMLVTVKQIEAELGHLPSKSGSGHQSAKVAVVMPSSSRFTVYEEDLMQVEPETNGRAAPEKKPADIVHKKQDQHDWIVDPLMEIPTLSHQQAARDLNDVIGHSGASLNDKLKGNVL
ncbi:MAG TPA: hypothetical protein VK543_03645, partial [Puia sp.]|nr:hypothetical protein [Puia sp.]